MSRTRRRTPRGMEDYYDGIRKVWYGCPAKRNCIGCGNGVWARQRHRRERHTRRQDIAQQLTP